jgi:hypothetical protein
MENIFNYAAMHPPVLNWKEMYDVGFLALPATADEMIPILEELSVKLEARIAKGEHTDRWAVHRFGEFPSAIHQVHLADYVPYARASERVIKRRDELDYFQMTTPAKRKFAKGDRRGPAWLPVQLHERDLARLVYRLRNIVTTVRLGRFLDQVDERCTRCHFSRECLNSGYAPTGDELVAVERLLKQAGI